MLIGANARQRVPGPPTAALRGKRPLRLLHVVEAFSPGVLEFVRQLANAADARGYEVHVAHARRPWTPPDFESRFADSVVFHHMNRGTRWGASWLLLSAGQLAVLMRRQRFDLIHLHSVVAGFTGAAGAPRGVPIVYTPNGYSFLMDSLPRGTRWFAEAVERIIGRRASVVGAVSESEAKVARSLGGRRVSVIHSGIAELDEIAERPPESRKASARRRGVVVAGRMSGQRQPLVVAEILGQLPEEAPKAWIGDSEDDEAARALTEAGAVITGWQPRDEVLELLRRARVYLHWSAWDGLPMSILEAIAAGSVAVARDIAPVREILGGAWVHRCADTAAQMVERLLLDDEYFAAAQHAQARSAVPFSSRAMSEQWCELYGELIRV